MRHRGSKSRFELSVYSDTKKNHQFYPSSSFQVLACVPRAIIVRACVRVCVWLNVQEFGAELRAVNSCEVSSAVVCSATFHPTSESSAELFAPLVHGAGPVDDEASSRGAHQLVSNDEVGLTCAQSWTATAEVCQRNPDGRLVAAP